MEFDVMEIIVMIFITVLFGILGGAQSWASDRWPYPQWFKLLIMCIVGLAYVIWLVHSLGLANLAA